MDFEGVVEILIFGDFLLVFEEVDWLGDVGILNWVWCVFGVLGVNVVEGGDGGVFGVVDLECEKVVVVDVDGL